MDLCIGAFASVGLCSLNGRTVAVKYLKPCLLQSDRDLNDFLKEAALLKKLSHSAVVKFVGVAIETESPEMSKSSNSLARKSVSFSKSAFKSIKRLLSLKKPRDAVGVEDQEFLDPNAAEVPSSSEPDGKMSVRLKNVMLVQEYMTRGTLKSVLLEQMEHSMRLIYTRSQALEWLIEIAQGLRSDKFKPFTSCSGLF